MLPPFKWIGGKRQALPTLLQAIRRPFRAYHEPFAGGAALFWSLAEERGRDAYLSDMHEDLIRCYQAIQVDPDTIAADLAKMVDRYYAAPETTYYSTRNAWNVGARTAGRFIFLKQTAYNGLWRVNSKGGMNSPWGKYKKLVVPNLSDLRRYSKLLAHTRIRIADFEEAINGEAQVGDLVYFDPPYLETFSAFTEGGFTRQDHIRLLKLCQDLDRSGVQVLYSQADSEEARLLVAEQWPEGELFEVAGVRSVNCKGKGRKGKDVLVRSR